MFRLNFVKLKSWVDLDWLPHTPTAALTHCAQQDMGKKQHGKTHGLRPKDNGIMEYAELEGTHKDY